VHQVNLEYLAKVVWEGEDTEARRHGGAKEESIPFLYPDSLVGTDSHTTMINGLGVVGWGVGGIEAEAVMLGQPIYMLLPEVIGFRLTGKLPEGATATDMVLVVTQMLRMHGVVDKFVEFFGPGLVEMPVANRATIANMAPEYGATIGFFPVDEQTLRYLELTGRDEKLIRTVEQYYKAQGMWRDDAARIIYSGELSLDLGTVEPSLAGPKRPQDRIRLRDMKSQWAADLDKTFNKNSTTLIHNPVGGWTEEGGAPSGQEGNMPAAADSAAGSAVLECDPGHAGVACEHEGETFHLKHGDVVIAAITSCTNTSNPSVMIGAGLLARNAVERGLSRKPWVKTSLAPGSKVVTEYLGRAGLLNDLERLGFYLVGYGCTTCIGNSGPLPDAISQAINEHDLVAASVLSGNRNFEGRIHPDCKANYLASPPLVVAYALAGTVNIDLANDPIGKDRGGRNVYLREIWPTQREIDDTIAQAVNRRQFQEQYVNVFEGSDEWKSIDVATGDLFQWDAESTYVQEPPFFREMPEHAPPLRELRGARCLVKVGDSVTTDHISPAGSIKKDSPAGAYLVRHGVPVSMFNSYGSRRGNDRVMVRGTFANTRIKNHLADGREGGWTRFLGAKAHGPESVGFGQINSIFDAAVFYGACETSDPDVKRRPDGVPLIVLAGKDYGMGSSRDWAAKGTFLLGIRAVIAESFERIHRSNLVGMGVLPLTFRDGESAQTLGLDGTEVFDIEVPANLQPKQAIRLRAHKLPSPLGRGAGGEGERSPRAIIEFETVCRVDTPVEVDYLRNGGILHTVLRKMGRD
jgi:aconitate hydratase